MPVHVENQSDASINELVAGIMRDARELLVQQLTLFQVEMKNDVERAAHAVSWLIAGSVVVLAGVMFLGLAIARFLFWLVPELLLWSGLALVGGGLMVAGAIVISRGMKALHYVLPDQSLETLKETIQWKKKN